MAAGIDTRHARSCRSRNGGGKAAIGAPRTHTAKEDHAMPRRLERILTPLDTLPGEVADEIVGALLTGWPGDRTDVDEITKAREHIDALDGWAMQLNAIVKDLRAELERVEQTEEA